MFYLTHSNIQTFSPLCLREPLVLVGITVLLYSLPTQCQAGNLSQSFFPPFDLLLLKDLQQHKVSQNSQNSPSEMYNPRRRRTHPIPVVVQGDELPLGQSLVDGEVGLAVEEVGHGAVHHTPPHPVEEFAEELLPLLPLALPPLFVPLVVRVPAQPRLVAALRFVVGAGGPRDGPAGVGLHTPAVALTAVTLDGQVSPAPGTLRHEGGRLAHRLLGGLQPGRLAVDLGRHHGLLLGHLQTEAGTDGLVLLVGRRVLHLPPPVWVLLGYEGREETEGN